MDNLLILFAFLTCFKNLITAAFRLEAHGLKIAFDLGLWDYVIFQRGIFE